MSPVVPLSRQACGQCGRSWATRMCHKCSRASCPPFSSCSRAQMRVDRAFHSSPGTRLEIASITLPTCTGTP
eukprot:6803709-Alexandrium_andersonii.AAC.1